MNVSEEISAAGQRSLLQATMTFDIINKLISQTGGMCFLHETLTSTCMKDFVLYI